MNYVDHIKQGLVNLYYAKLRSLLALLGVLVGTASVVAMVMGGELATNEALKEFKSLGTDLLAMSINPAMNDDKGTSAKPEHLSLDQALSLADHDSSIRDIAPYTQLYYPVYYQGNNLNGLILGVTDQMAQVINIQLTAGRFVSLADRYAFYCVIGHQLYEEMKKISFQDPIGQKIQVGPHVFVIVGVAAPWPENSFVYANVDYAVLMPLRASTLVSPYATINNIIIRLKPNAIISSAQASLKRQAARFVPHQVISFRSAKELIAKMRKQSDILTAFLGLIGSISLLVGGIGVMNIMLVAVIERKREIGIRLAVGAKRADIWGLFLMEAVMLSLVGGLLGVVIGIIIAYVIALFWHWEFTFFIWPPLAGFTVSVLVGIFFGFYPAYVASKLDPIQALRAEKDIHDPLIDVGFPSVKVRSGKSVA